MKRELKEFGELKKLRELKKLKTIHSDPEAFVL